MTMRRFIIAAVGALCATLLYIPAALAQSRPTRQVSIPTEGRTGSGSNSYMEYDKGFFMAAEVSGGCSLNAGLPNFGYLELDAVGGYRFSEYLRAGIGLGGRYYVNNANERNTPTRWGLPLFLNLRGNFIPGEYRDVTPFWSADVGTTFPDGLMLRPSIGIRVGQQRSAFVLSVGYMGQNIRVYDSPRTGAKHHFYSFVMMKLGYEF